MTSKTRNMLTKASSQLFLTKEIYTQLTASCNWEQSCKGPSHGRVFVNCVRSYAGTVYSPNLLIGQFPRKKLRWPSMKKVRDSVATVTPPSLLLTWAYARFSTNFARAVSLLILVLWYLWCAHILSSTLVLLSPLARQTTESTPA